MDGWESRDGSRGEWSAVGAVRVSAADRRARWLALLILCLGTLMIVLDTTIVNVALPRSRGGPGFSATSLAWVVNGYLLTFGGFLLLGGRLGDLFGPRRLFIGRHPCSRSLRSLAVSRAAQGLLVAARAVQGFGGADRLCRSLPDDGAVHRGRRAGQGDGHFRLRGRGGRNRRGARRRRPHRTPQLALDLSRQRADRCRRLRVWASVLPAGTRNAGQKLDLGGAVCVTAALMLAVYAIVNGNQAGWTSAQTLGLLGGALVLLAAS